MGTPRDKSLKACIWVRRWLIWSGVNETGVCGDCGGGWAEWLRGGAGICGILGGAPLATGVWPFVSWLLESPARKMWAVSDTTDGAL